MGFSRIILWDLPGISWNADWANLKPPFTEYTKQGTKNASSTGFPWNQWRHTQKNAWQWSHAFFNNSQYPVRQTWAKKFKMITNFSVQSEWRLWQLQGSFSTAAVPSAKKQSMAACLLGSFPSSSIYLISQDVSSLRMELNFGNWISK